MRREADFSTAVASAPPSVETTFLGLVGEESGATGSSSVVASRCLSRSRVGFVVTISERSFKPNYSALLHEAEADSIGGIVHNQVRCQLVAGKRREML